MNHAIQTAKTYIASHQKAFTFGLQITVAVAVIVFVVALIDYNNPSKIVYRPTDACQLFTPAEAESLLGDHVYGLNTSRPVIAGNVATSKCSYSDANPDRRQMLVAAIAVRSGINDQGVRQNKTEFHASKDSQAVEAVPGLGADAYFNRDLGQLNVLTGRNWLIISYGVGTLPQNNTLADTLTLASLALPDLHSKLPQF